MAKQQAAKAYSAMWQDMAQAAETSDWNSPLLGRHATGDALLAMSRGMYADHRNGLITKGSPKNYPKVTSARPAEGPSTVRIDDCGDSTAWLKYRKKTGKLADTEPGGRHSIQAEVTKQENGQWKVTRFAVAEVGSC
ncbi:hypothetical protein [Streptomyces sp. ODS28]|uniref:hypothetical protein n=1 Tax=Streptomyces sp. ODS28 TaxID=3136688 RepID=UPI0031E65142